MPARLKAGDQPCDRPASPCGAPPQRLKSLGPRFPLAPVWLAPSREGVRTKPWASVLRREAVSKDSRDHGCEPRPQAPLPVHIQVRLENVPPANGDGCCI